MADILTIVIDKADQSLDSVIAAAVNEIHNLGHSTREVRVANDSGESKVPLNTVAGVTPAAAGFPEQEPTPEPAPAEEETTETTPDDETTEATPPVDTPPAEEATASVQ